MKQIFLAKKGKRILARLIDLIILFFSTFLLFFTLIYPNTFNKEQFNKNSIEIIEYFKDSELFIVDDNGNYSAKSTLASFKKIDDLYNNDLSFNNKEYKNVSLTKSLYDFYTIKYKEYGGVANLNNSQYENEVLLINNSESNIKSYDFNSHTLKMIDSSKEDVTLTYFLNKYESTCKNMIKNSKINDLTNENQKLIFTALSGLLPTLFVFAFIYEFIIPCFSKYGETIGKHIFKIGLVNKDGYEIKKYQLFIRFLAYYFMDILLSAITFGGVFIITYTMMLFTKKRRCIHDFISGTVVINTVNSIIFKNKNEELYYLNKINKVI